MTRISLLAVGLLCLISFAAPAADKKQTSDELCKAWIKHVNDISDILEKVKDDASADQAVAKLKKLSKVVELGNAIEALAKEDQNKAKDKYKDEADKAWKRMEGIVKNLGKKISKMKSDDLLRAAGFLQTFSQPSRVP